MLLRQMKFFLAAVYCKSFSEAAKQCFVSQPSFSLQIQQLEKELGVKLINRGNCNFSLTPAGENFLKPCERIVGDIQNLLQNMQHFAEKSQIPHYTIGCKTGYNVCRLLNVINNMNKNTEMYHLEIIYGDHEQLMLMLKNKEIDMVISEDRKTNDKHLQSEIIEIADLYTCIPTTTIPKDKSVLDISELAYHTCVIISDRAHASQEINYYRNLLNFYGDFFVVRDVPTALTKVIDDQKKSFMPVPSNSDALFYFQNFTRFLPLKAENEYLEITYKIFWSKHESNPKIASIANHIVSLMQDH